MRKTYCDICGKDTEDQKRLEIHEPAVIYQNKSLCVMITVGTTPDRLNSSSPFGDGDICGDCGTEAVAQVLGLKRVQEER